MLLHPNSSTNAAILKDVIQELKAQGYRFGTLDELKAYSESKNTNSN
jgi:peptidoglycan/xylan/chitin deacetylase (PgdA/CDA1 family)